MITLLFIILSIAAALAVAGFVAFKILDELVGKPKYRKMMDEHRRISGY